MFICIVYFLLYSMNVLLNCIILFVLYELYLHCIILHLCLIISVCMKNHPEVTSISLIFFFRKEININVISIIWKKIKLLISHRFALILWTFTNRWTIKKILENIDVQLLFWIYYIEYYQDVWLLQSKSWLKYTDWVYKGHVFWREYSFRLWFNVLYWVI